MKTDFYILDRKIAQIEKKIHLVSLLKPINLFHVKKRFLKDPNTNPQFQYREAPFAIDDLKKKLNQLNTDKSPLGLLFHKKIDELNLKLELISKIGTPGFQNISQKLYGLADTDLVKRAYAILKSRKSKKPDKKHSHQFFSSEETAKIFQRIFKEYRLANWRVKIKDYLVTDCTAGKKNALFIRRNARFSRSKISRLIAHEIETHIFTAENGKFQPYEIFNRGFAGYLETQEGLAIFNEEKRRKKPSTLEFWAAISVIAVHKAQYKSFSEVYFSLLKLGLSEEMSFRIASRVKRGLCDTSKKGAFTKDIIYFKGIEKIHKFTEMEKNIRMLYIGKVALEDLSFIKQIPHIVSPKYLPKWLLSLQGSEAIGGSQ